MGVTTEADYDLSFCALNDAVDSRVCKGVELTELTKDIKDKTGQDWQAQGGRFASDKCKGGFQPPHARSNDLMIYISKVHDAYKHTYFEADLRFGVLNSLS